MQLSSAPVVYLRLAKILMKLLRLLVRGDGDDEAEAERVDVVSRVVVLVRMMAGCASHVFARRDACAIAFFLALAKHSSTWRAVNERLHALPEADVSERVRKDSRVLLRMAVFFEEAITLEFAEWQSSEIQTPLHHSRALRLVRETLKGDEFEVPPAKLNGQHLGYQEEPKFFNDSLKLLIAKLILDALH